MANRFLLFALLTVIALVELDVRALGDFDFTKTMHTEAPALVHLVQVHRVPSRLLGDANSLSM
jgi:hypothetical protein